MLGRVTFGAAIGALLASNALAQIEFKEDDKWRFALGAGWSHASGNSRANTLNATIDGAKASSTDKLTFGGRYLRGETDGETTADQLMLTARYDRDLNEDIFAFGLGDFLRDRPANLNARLAGAVGVGHHVVKSERISFDVFGGVGYTYDDYVEATVVDGLTRSTYRSLNLLLGEESDHKISETASFHQRLVLYPNLKDTGEFRGTFDAGVSVAINKHFSLTATLGYRYSSDPGLGVKRRDSLFVTGLSYRIE
ncbi:MAG: DUF481 domain-containing protein [Burkholderiaceae bacterium]